MSLRSHTSIAHFTRGSSSINPYRQPRIRPLPGKRLSVGWSTANRSSVRREHMKLPGLSSSPPKTPDVTPNAPKPEAKPSQDASKPADTQNNSGNGGNSATGNFSNVAQGTGSLASGGASLYRADQSSQNQPQATQGNQGAQGSSGGVSYGSNSGGSIPPSLQNNTSSQQSQGLSGSDGLSKLLSPLAKMLEKVLGTMLQHSGGGSSMQYVGGNASAQNKPLT
uniref:Putative type III effector protein n=1 Tax=Pseudomonas syringae pv. syringae TaxID=321 RepID=C8BNW5_PSESY|nr:putative type III effector protein [Pseudomonas syringae pv. syringae]